MMFGVRIEIVDVYVVMCFSRLRLRVCIFFFFFQAEDGIRDLTVTGVQTCALPISQSSSPQSQESPHKTSSLEVSRPTSPIPRTGSSFGSRTTSPISFGYPYHQSDRKSVV